MSDSQRNENDREGLAVPVTELLKVQGKTPKPGETVWLDFTDPQYPVGLGALYQLLDPQHPVGLGALYQRQS